MVATRARDNKLEERIGGWITGPATKIDLPDARRYLESCSNELHEAELGAFRQNCDWEFDRREEGYRLLLPEIQEIRRVGRMIALKVRLAILDGQTDEAMHWLKVGFAMSRHIGDAPFFIPGLVGISIANLLVFPVEELIQKSGDPNLYWALAIRPRPLIDMRRCVEGERDLLECELPGLREVDGLAWSTERARRFGDELFDKLKGFAGNMYLITSAEMRGITGAPRLKDLPSRLALSAMVARVYPEAKRALIAEGRNLANVEAMPTLQVVLIHTLKEYNQFRDDIFKWVAFPYWQAAGRTWKPQNTAATKFANPLLTMFIALSPALESAILANARLERHFDAIQCVEAIRMYAAEHDGALPESLDAMTETPIPIDPVIGKPFEYRKVDDTTATLIATYPPGGPKIPQYTIRYELKFAK
jgi:hypothetical protein